MTVDGDTLVAVVPGLATSETYIFFVTATNAIGDSSPSGPSIPVIYCPCYPDPPADVSAIAAPGEATVSWSAPASDGGSPITQYTATSSPGGLTASVDGATLSATVTGLANGTAYTFTITATNAVGTSDPSAPSSPVTYSAYDLLFSAAADRSNPASLDGANVSGNIYVFVGPETGINRVRFFLDDPTMAGTPIQTENNAPYDFNGGSGAAANPYDSTQLADGQHTITASIDLSGGGTEVVTATFTIGG